MPKCLRCGAGAEWLQGTVKQQPAECQECIDKDIEIERLKRAMCTAINDLEKIKGFRSEAPRLASAACRVLSKALKALAGGEGVK